MLDAEALKARIDLAELLGIPAGKDLIRCPLGIHEDNNPSCSVDPGKGLFNCFSCGHGGDALDYFGYRRFGAAYTKREHFQTVLEDAAAYVGERPEGPNAPYKARPKPGVEGVIKKREKIKAETASRPGVGELCAKNQARFSEALDSAALTYWESRGFDLTLSKALGMGKTWGQGADRATFPMTQPDGEIRKHYGRAIPPHSDAVPKVVYTSRKDLGLTDEKIGGWFNAPALKTEHAIYFCESPPDALALIQSGYPGAIALGGIYLGAYDPKWLTDTATLPRPVFVCFDADKAGVEGAEKIKAALEAATMGLVTVTICTPPAGVKDYAEALEKGIPIDLPRPARADSPRDRRTVPKIPAAAGDYPIYEGPYETSPLYRTILDLYDLAEDHKGKDPAADELAALLFQLDDTIGDSIEAGDENGEKAGRAWVARWGWRIQELTDHLTKGTPLAPLLKGAALSQAVRCTFSIKSPIPEDPPATRCA